MAADPDDVQERIRRGDRVRGRHWRRARRRWSSRSPRGRSSKEIAAALHISLKTVDLHLANVLAKLGMQDRTELIRYAIRTGLVEP